MEVRGDLATGSSLARISSATHTSMRTHNYVPDQGGRQSTVSGKPCYAFTCSPTDRVFRKHVYGFHILPIKCPSCSQTFESSRMFTRHIHATPQCDRSHDEADDPMKGLETLLEKIRSPKIVAGDPLEDDKWKAIYTILFPSDPKDAIPSPCEPLSSTSLHSPLFGIGFTTIAQGD